MTLNDLLIKLATGVLSNLSLVDKTLKNIKHDKIDVVIGFINEGLIELYNNFDLKRDYVYLELVDAKVEYEISSEHNLSQSDLIPDYDHYLWKGGNKQFDDNLIKILEIKSTLTGNTFPLNDYNNPASILTPTYNVIQIPLFDVREKLIISYTAKHSELNSSNLDAHINIPSTLIKALCSYVAYAIHNNMNTQEAVANANKYYSQYTNEISKVTNTGNAKSIYTEDTSKFYLRGWV